MNKLNKIIGQKQLLNKLSKYEVLPSTMILSGLRGSGKHLIANYLSNSYNLKLIDITENISSDFINETYTSTLPTLYVIDTSLITEKQQNVILKFIEEPPFLSHIILLSNNKNLLLETILNRCISFEMDFYTKEELKEFLEQQAISLNKDNEEFIFSILKTPGQLLDNANLNSQKLYSFCEKIVDKLTLASYYNTLTIGNQVNLSNNYDLFDIDVFFNTLLLVITDRYKATHNKKLTYMYKIVNEYAKNLNGVKLNLQYLFDNFLTKLWKEMKLFKC